MKILLILGFASSVILAEDLAVWLWGNAILANWCSIILPSFFMGIFWKLLTNDDLEDNFRFVIPGTLGVVKLALFIMRVNNPTLGGGIGIAVVYPPVSYLFLRIGHKVAFRKTKEISMSRSRAHPSIAGISEKEALRQKIKEFHSGKGMSIWELGDTLADVWRQVCMEIGADFDFARVRDPFICRFLGPKALAKVGEWFIASETWMRISRHGTFTHTGIRAPYMSKDGFRFSIHRRGIFSRLGERLGIQHISVGDPYFDSDLIVKSKNESKVLVLLANPRIRKLIRLHYQTQPSISLYTLYRLNASHKYYNTWFGPYFPKEGVEELYISIEGIVMDMERLRSLFELLTETLNQLYLIGSADPITETSVRIECPRSREKKLNLVFKCQSCGKDIIVKYLKVGETAKCRSCGNENVVPESAVETREEPDYSKH